MSETEHTPEELAEEVKEFPAEVDDLRSGQDHSGERTR